MSLKTELLPHRLDRLGGAQMRGELQEAFPHASLHPMSCDCSACSGGNDPIATRRERVVRIQAALLGVFVVAIYALALALLPNILRAFGVQL